MADQPNLLDRFEKFCRVLTIESKEEGIVPLRLNGAQRYAMQEIVKGFEEGIRTFVILKGRQAGLSTLCLALDLYWQYRCPGIQGTLVTDTDENKEYFRSILKNYITNLPIDAKAAEIQTLNRTLLALENRSRLMFQVAGVRQANTNLGRGKGINFMHATECAFWADQEGLAALVASLAQKYRHRLYVFESTANGYNAWHEICQAAKEAVMRRFIFVGWWRNENFACPKGSPQYECYQGEPDGEEIEWVSAVKELYGYDITQEQLAWWRWQLYEEMADPAMMMQEYPPTEHHAWVMTGSAFFSTRVLTDSYNAALKRPPKQYAYHFGTHFYDTTIHEDNEGELHIWENPVEGAKYVVGVDPAWGASDTSDYYAVQVFRCYANGMDQVAEYRARNINAYKCAWIIAHLAGAYRGELNIELNASGNAVHHELERLKNEATYFDSHPPNEGKGWDPNTRLKDIIGGISYYLYYRQDSVSRATSSYHTVTSNRIKATYMHGFRDGFERHEILLRSQRLLTEMRTIREDQGRIAASGRGNDDLTIACGLATLTWMQWVQPQLMMKGQTREAALVTAQGQKNPVEIVVGSFLQMATRDRPRPHLRGRRRYS